MYSEGSFGFLRIQGSCRQTPLTHWQQWPEGAALRFAASPLLSASADLYVSGSVRGSKVQFELWGLRKSRGPRWFRANCAGPWVQTVQQLLGLRDRDCPEHPARLRTFEATRSEVVGPHGSSHCPRAASARLCSWLLGSPGKGSFQERFFVWDAVAWRAYGSRVPY